MSDQARRQCFRRVESRQAVGLLERRLRLSGRDEAAEVLRFVASTGGAGLGRDELSRLLLMVIDALQFIRKLNAAELAALHRFNNGVQEWLAAATASPPPVAGNPVQPTARALHPSRPNGPQRIA